MLLFLCFFSLYLVKFRWKKNEILINENQYKFKEGLTQKKVEQSEAQLLASLNALAKARDNETGNHIIRYEVIRKSYCPSIDEKWTLFG
jgi:response regulator RpfG family c-di-GMP phosphodiesterase